MNKSGRLEDIKKIYTIAPAAAQCRQWLEKNLAGVPVLDAASTARAAEMASDDPTVAAIASEMAAVCTGSRSREKNREAPATSHDSLLLRESPGKTGREQDLDHVFHQGQGGCTLFHACAVCRGAST